jgi:C_GCAxxG_C_C family probable redox protein
MKPEDEAKRLFDGGFNCAESVLLATSRERFPQNIGTVIPRIATGFGGGIGRNGDVCGALSGGVMAIGLATGRDSSEESRDPCYLAVDRFYSDFVREFGTCKCRELTGVDLKTTKGREEYLNRVHADVCCKIVVWATQAVSRLIEKSR